MSDEQRAMKDALADLAEAELEPTCLGCGGPSPSFAEACSQKCADEILNRCEMPRDFVC